MFEYINFGSERAQLFNLLLVGSGNITMTAPIYSHRSIPIEAGRPGLTAIPYNEIHRDPDIMSAGMVESGNDS